MTNLADLARSFGPNEAVSDVFEYRKYVIACSEVGKTPLPMPEWVKAGKPDS